MFPDATEVERLRYRQGQRLRSRDFRDQAAVDAQLRWWHNRALHNAYGIAVGLVPEVSVDGAETIVTIGSGVAYDCFGRELVLQRDRVVRVPDRDVNLTLVLRHRERAGDERVPHAADLVWQETARLTFRDGVAVCQIPRITSVELALSVKMRQAVEEASNGRVVYEDGALITLGVMSRSGLDALLGEPVSAAGALPLEDLLAYRAAIRDLFERSQIEYGRSGSRRLVRPRMATGATIAGSTAWTPWLPAGKFVVGLQVQIDTSMGGFTEVPCCFASLQGMPPLRWPVFEHTDDVQTTGFVFRFWTPFPEVGRRVLDTQQIDLVSIAAKLKLFVRWWAVQPAAGAAGLAR